MFTKKCRCGQSEKNFKFDIGDFYIDECCTRAGYDELGNKEEKGMSNEELSKLAEGLDSASDLVIKDDPKADEPTEAEKEEAKAEEVKAEEPKAEEVKEEPKQEEKKEEVKEAPKAAKLPKIPKPAKQG